MTAIMARSECRAQTGRRSSWWHQSVHILHHSFFLIENGINYISYCFLLSKQIKNHNPPLIKVKRQHRDAVVGVRAPSCPICYLCHPPPGFFAPTTGCTFLEDLAPEAVVVTVAYEITSLIKPYVKAGHSQGKAYRNKPNNTNYLHTSSVGLGASGPSLLALNIINSLDPAFLPWI